VKVSDLARRGTSGWIPFRDFRNRVAHTCFSSGNEVRPDIPPPAVRRNLRALDPSPIGLMIEIVAWFYGAIDVVDGNAMRPLRQQTLWAHSGRKQNRTRSGQSQNPKHPFHE